MSAQDQPPAAIQFGVGLFPYDRFQSPSEVIEVARAADELGYDVVSLTEHLAPPRWPDAVNHTWYDPVALAAVLAGATTRVKFLTSVLVVPYHHPIRLAKSLATLDVLSGGRVLLGVGTGWSRGEFKRLGIAFEERGPVTDEYLRAMIELWKSESPKFHGKYVSFEDIDFEPKPVQQPHIPLLIGGTGPRPFQRVAEIGSGWLPMAGDLAAGIADIRRRMKALGRDSSGLWVGSHLPLGIDPDAERAREHHRGVDREPVALRTPAEIVSEVERLRALGVTFLSTDFEWADTGDLLRQMERFATEVIPLCKPAPS